MRFCFCNNVTCYMYVVVALVSYTLKGDFERQFERCLETYLIFCMKYPSLCVLSSSADNFCN